MALDQPAARLTGVDHDKHQLHAAAEGRFELRHDRCQVTDRVVQIG